MSYTSEDLASMSDQTLANIMNFGIDSGIPEYLQDVRQCGQELKRRGKKVSIKREYNSNLCKFQRIVRLAK